MIIKYAEESVEDLLHNLKVLKIFILLNDLIGSLLRIICIVSQIKNALRALDLKWYKIIFKVYSNGQLILVGNQKRMNVIFSTSSSKFLSFFLKKKKNL